MPFGRAMGMGMGGGNNQQPRMNAAGSRFGQPQTQPKKMAFGAPGPQGSQGMGGAMMGAVQNRFSKPQMGGGPNQNYQQMMRGLGPSLNNVSPMMQKPQMMPQQQQQRGDDYMYDPGNGMPKTPYIPLIQPQPGGLRGPEMPRIMPDPEFENAYMGFRNQGMEFPQAMDATQAQLGNRNPMDRIRQIMQPESRGIGPSSPYEQMLQPRISVNDFAGRDRSGGIAY